MTPIFVVAISYAVLFAHSNGLSLDSFRWSANRSSSWPASLPETKEDYSSLFYVCSSLPG